MHKITSIRLDENLLKEAKIESIYLGKSLSDYIKGLIAADLEQKKSTHP